jgi:hypothetical protein
MFENCENCYGNSCRVDFGCNGHRYCCIEELNIEKEKGCYECVSSELYSSGDFVTDTENFNTYDEALQWLYETHWDICCGNRDPKIIVYKNDKIDYEKMFEKCKNCSGNSCRIDFGSNGYRYCRISKLDLEKK